MKEEKKEKDAVGILHKRYIGDSAERKSSLQAERVNAEAAKTIYELRNQAGLTQSQLAKLVGTTQSVISRLEDADYDGHSLSMLNRIAKALNTKLNVGFQGGDPENSKVINFVFREVVKGLRRSNGLSIDKLSKKIDIDKEDLISMERDNKYQPTPFALHKLSNFYNVSHRKLAMLAGAISDIPQPVMREASKFAAQSESFSNLTNEEKDILDKFVSFLRTEEKD